MHLNSNSNSSIRIIPPGIYVLSGVVQVNVDGGQLHVHAGTFDDRPEMYLTKADAQIRRLVVLGHSGTLSLHALRWLYQVGAGVIQVDYDASVVFATIPLGLDHARLRRAQALAMHSPDGLAIAQWLIEGKVSGQAGVCRTLGDEAAAREVEKFLGRIKEARSAVMLRSLESQASVQYWQAWSRVPVQFARKDEAKVRHQWKAFGLRASPLTNAPRRAGNPANAMLNYLYALLDSETRIAILTMGLDPGVGILHADQPARDSLVYDLMEPVRPAVDAWLLALLRERRFARDDFCESPDGRGQIMLTQHMAHELVSTMPLWARMIAPVVEQMARRLLSRKGHTARPEDIPTKLTEAHRSRKGRDFAHQATRKAAATAEKPPRSCLQCGKPTRSTSRYCSRECMSVYRKEVLDPGFTRKGTAALETLRASGRDPAHGGEAAQKRGRSNARRAQDRAEWEALGLDIDSEKARFVEEIQPKLARLTVKQIENATGLSLRYALLIRDGRYVPHPVHYEALAALVKEPPASH